MGGVEDLRALGKLLKEQSKADRKGFRKELNLAMNEAARPLTELVRRNALATLPREGGLNVWVADASYRTITYTGMSRTGVQIRGLKRGHNLQIIDRGYVRHPVFGTWRAIKPSAKWPQRIPPGFFTKPLERVAGPLVASAMNRVVDDTIRKIEAS